MYLVFISITSILCFSFNIHRLPLKKLLFINLAFLISLSLIIFDIHRPRTSEINEKTLRLSNRNLFDYYWKFSFDQKIWIDVTLPHTARLEPIEKIEAEWQGTCFYQKQFFINDTNFHWSLRFDGAMHEANVWINEQHAARHLGGYLPFDVPLIINQTGEVNILVELKNTDHSSIPPGKKLSELDFNYYGGLYRHVWLIQKSKQCYLDPMIYIDYRNVSRQEATMIVRYKIISTIETCAIQFLLNNYEIRPSRTIDNSESHFYLINPRLWSPAEPNLYDFTIILIDQIRKDLIYDRDIRRIGVRSVELHRETRALLINGEKSDFIVGTNRHQEYPYLGYAISDAANYRDAYKIKQAGFQLVRCSHYPPSTSFLDACDALGLLVIDSIPGWQYFGDEIFQKNSLNDVRGMIRRDYNHPSIILWEVSLNESPMSEEFMSQAHQVAKIVKSDALTCGWIDDPHAYDVFIPARQHGEGPIFYSEYRAKRDKPLLIAEYGDWEYFAARKDNFNQLTSNSSKKIPAELTSRQRRSDGQKRLLRQAKNFQQAHNDNRRSSRTARILGDANWLMFDYKRGYAKSIESSGVMDINRLPKFVFYFYQSQCLSCPPMIFIANYWTNSDDTTVIIYSNCDQVELRLNDRSISNGERQKDSDSSDLLRPPFIFTIDQFESGLLEAIGLNNGRPVVRTSRSTPGKIHHQLRLEMDESGQLLTNNDVVFIYAYVIDENNTVIPDATDSIQFSIKIPTSYEEVSLIGENPVRAEAGIASILLKTHSTISVRHIVVLASSKTIVIFMDIIPIAIIWCDAQFEHQPNYQTMRDQFNRITTGQSSTPRLLTDIDEALLNDMNEMFDSNPDLITFVANVDDALTTINNYREKKLFVITSGTLGEYLVREAAEKYSNISHFYLFAHNLEIHLALADQYASVLRMFNFPTSLLLRLTRDISQFFIVQGNKYLTSFAPGDALQCFRHSRNLEHAANTYDSSSSFLERLNLLEGPEGLIAKAESELIRRKLAVECV